MTSPTKSQRISPANNIARWAIGAAVLLSVALVMALWSVDYLPTHDGPQHVYLGHVANHFSDPGSIYRKFYRPGRPLTSLGFAVFFVPLEHFLPWQTALRLALATISLLWAWGAFLLIRRVEPKRSAIGLLAFGAAVQWALYMGFFSFMAGTALGFFAIALSLGPSPWTKRRVTAVGLLLLLTSIAHVFPALLATSAVILILALTIDAETLPKRTSAVAASIASAPTVLIAAYTFLSATKTPAAHIPAGLSIVYWPSWLKRLADLADLFIAGPVWRSWPIILLAVGGIIAAGIATRRRQLDRSQLAVGMMASSLLIAAIIVPLHVRGHWEFISPRFLPLFAILGLALLPIERLRGKLVGPLLLATFTVHALASLSWAGTFHRKLAHACGPALAGLNLPLHRHGVRLPIVLDTKCGHKALLHHNRVKYVEPLLNVGALYAVQQGGIVPYIFALQPEIHPFVLTRQGLKRFPPVPERRKWWTRAAHSRHDVNGHLRVLTTLASYTPYYEDVIATGTRDELRVFRQRGFTAVMDKPNLLIGTFSGCPLSLDIHWPEASRHPTLTVSYGWVPLTKPAWGVRMSAPPPTRTQHLSLPYMPCGSSWVRVVAGPFGPSRRRMFCAGSTATGALSVKVDNKLTHINCNLVEATP